MNDQYTTPSTFSTSAVTSLLNAIKADLIAHPTDMKGFHDSVLDLIYQYHTEFISAESEESKAKHLEGAKAIFKIMKERDAARGVETPGAKSPLDSDKQEADKQEADEEEYPYNKELEEILFLFTQEVAMIEKSLFSAGFSAGARLVFELMGEGPVGIV